MRYLFNRPVRGSYELVECMLLVFVFNGMAAAFFGRRNIVIDLLDSVVGERVTAVLIRIADILSVLCLGLLAWAMLLPAGRPIEYGDIKMELRSADLRALDRRAGEPRRHDLLRAGRRWSRSRPWPIPGGPNEPIADRRGRRLVLFALLFLRVPVWIALVLVGFFGNVLVLRLAGRVRARRHGAVRRRLLLHAVGRAAVHPDGRGGIGIEAVRASCSRRRA